VGSGFDIEVVTSLAGLEPHRRGWGELADAAGMPLLRPEWIGGAMATLHDGHDPHVVVARRAGSLVAIAPLVRTRGPGGSRIESPGARALAEPCDVLAADADARAALTEALAGLGEVVVLRRVPTGSGTGAAIERAARGRARVLRRDMHPSLAVPIGDDPEAFEAGLSDGHRRNLRRRRRAAERVGAVEFEMRAPSADEAPALLAAFVELEADGWKGRNRSALAARDDLRAFFEGYVRDAAALGMLRVAGLRIAGAVAALWIGVERDRCRWELKIAYDERLARCSPGVLLTFELLRDAHRAGVRAHEFLGSAADWQRAWPTVRRDYATWIVYPHSVRGAIALGADAFAALARRRRRRREGR